MLDLEEETLESNSVILQMKKQAKWGEMIWPKKQS